MFVLGCLCGALWYRLVGELYVVNPEAIHWRIELEEEYEFKGKYSMGSSLLSYTPLIT